MVNATRVGGLLLVVGAVLVIASLFLGHTHRCLLVGSEGGSFEITGVDWTEQRIGYTPDGGHSMCNADFGVVVMPIGVLFTGVGILMSFPVASLKGKLEKLRSSR